MSLSGHEHELRMKEVSTMELWKHTVSGLPRTSASTMNGVDSRRSVGGKQVSLSSRVRGIDCMLADIEAQIQRLQQERIYLSLVREGLTDMLCGSPIFKVSVDESPIGTSGSKQVLPHRSLGQQRGR